MRWPVMRSSKDIETVGGTAFFPASDTVSGAIEGAIEGALLSGVATLDMPTSLNPKTRSSSANSDTILVKTPWLA